MKTIFLFASLFLEIHFFHTNNVFSLKARLIALDLVSSMILQVSLRVSVAVLGSRVLAAFLVEICRYR